MPRRIIRGLEPLGILALTLLISGCIGTHGIQPHASLLAADRLATDQAIQSAARDARWPTAQWWRAYGDAQLDRWIELATLGSPSLAIAAARVRQAKAMVQSNASLQRHDWPSDQFYRPGALADTRTWDNNASLGFSYSLDIWGRERQCQ